MKILLFLFIFYPISLLSLSAQNVPSVDNPIAIAVTNNLPAVGFTKEMEMVGFCGLVLSILNTYFNISFQVIETKDGQFGGVKKGNWTGMVGDIVSGKVDIAPCISLTRKRRDYIDYSPQLIVTKYIILYRKSKQIDWDDAFYFKPFPKTVWKSVLGISLTTIIVMVLSSVLTKTHVTESINSFTKDLLLFWPIVIPSDVPISSLRTSSKICVVVYFFFSMLLLSVYTSLLCSLFATTKVKIPFTSLEEMRTESDFDALTIKGWSAQEVIVKLFGEENLLEVDTMEQGIEMAFNEKMGLVIQKEVLDFLGKNCSFAFASEVVSIDIVSLGYSKQFQYKEYFNSKIIFLKETGMLNILKSRARYTYDWEECKNSKLFYVSIEQITGPFVVFLIGVAFAVGCWVLELFVRRKNLICSQ